jgi:hypothetical protein
MATMVLNVLHFVEGSQLLVLLLQISHLFLLFILALVFSKLFQDGLALHINSARWGLVHVLLLVLLLMVLHHQHLVLLGEHGHLHCLSRLDRNSWGLPTSLGGVLVTREHSVGIPLKVFLLLGC